MSRCIALDSHGRQCRRKADGAYSYHGEPELYSDKVTWVAAPFCFYHHGHTEETHARSMWLSRRERKKRKLDPLRPGGRGE